MDIKMNRVISAAQCVSRTQLIIIVLLFAIISVGAVLRLAGIGSVGPEGTNGIDTDAFTYLDTGRLVATGFDAVILRARSISEVEGYLIHVPKPLHGLLIGTVMTVVQNDHAIWAGHLIGAIFGTLTIPVIFILGRQLAGVAVGLVAASISAISAYNVHYSRTALAETDANFFVYLSLVLLIASWRAQSYKWARWQSFAAGAAAGLALTVNYRLAWVPAAILLFSVIRLVSRRRMPTPPETFNTGIILIGSLTPLILYGIPSYVIVKWFSGPFDPDMLVKWSYFHQLYQWLFVMGVSGGIQVDLLLFPRLWLITDGYLPILLFGAGIFAIIRQRAFMLLAVLSIVATPYLFHSITSNHAARYFAIALPGIAVICGYAILALPERLRLGTAVALSVLIIAIGIPITWNQLRFSPSTYQAIANEMNANGIQSHYTSSEPAARFWFNQSHVFPLKDRRGLLLDHMENYECRELEAIYAVSSNPAHINSLDRQGATIIAEAKFPPLPSVLYYSELHDSRFAENIESFQNRFIAQNTNLSLMNLCDFK